MQSNEMNRRATDRMGAKGTAQAMGGQPRSEEEDEELQQPEQVPSFITARELQFGRRKEDREAGERHASASFAGSKGEPTISDEEPARENRGMPEERTTRVRGRDMLDD